MRKEAANSLVFLQFTISLSLSSLVPENKGRLSTLKQRQTSFHYAATVQTDQKERIEIEFRKENEVRFSCRCCRRW